jgi:hypothetical protein
MVGDGAFRQQRGEIFLDTRTDERALRLSWHHEQSVVVFSLWRGPGPGSTCVGTFRMPISEVPALIQFLVDGLAGTAGVGPSRAAS